MSVTAFVKRRQLGDRVIRHISPEMLPNQSADKLFNLEGNMDMNVKARTYSALRGLRSAMSHNAFASTGESLHSPYHPNGLMYKWYAVQPKKKESKWDAGSRMTA